LPYKYTNKETTDNASLICYFDYIWSVTEQTRKDMPSSVCSNSSNWSVTTNFNTPINHANKKVRFDPDIPDDPETPKARPMLRRSRVRRLKLIEEAKNSPPLSPTCTHLHPLAPAKIKEVKAPVFTEKAIVKPINYQMFLYSLIHRKCSPIKNTRKHSSLFMKTARMAIGFLMRRGYR